MDHEVRKWNSRRPHGHAADPGSASGTSWVFTLTDPPVDIEELAFSERKLGTHPTDLGKMDLARMLQLSHNLTDELRNQLWLKCSKPQLISGLQGVGPAHTLALGVLPGLAFTNATMLGSAFFKLTIIFIFYTIPVHPERSSSR